MLKLKNRGYAGLEYSRLEVERTTMYVDGAQHKAAVLRIAADSGKPSDVVLTGAQLEALYRQAVTAGILPESAPSDIEGAL